MYHEEVSPDVEGAVQNALNEITDAQVASKLLDYIVHYLREHMARSFLPLETEDSLNNSIQNLRVAIYQQLNEAWNQLSWFGTVNLRAKQTLHERAKSWFEREDTEKMSFIGRYGSYLVVDRESFDKSLREAFGIKENDSE